MQTGSRTRPTIRRTRPALAFGVVGQARARGLLTPEGEDRLLGSLISYWALHSTLQANARLAAFPAPLYLPGPGPAYRPLPGPGCAASRGGFTGKGALDGFRNTDREIRSRR